MLRRNKAVFLVILIFSVTVLVNLAGASAPPVAAFTYSPTAPILSDVVIFNASASYDPDGGNISSYRWNFDDGTVYTIFDPITYHNYTAVGNYNVTLTVTDGEALTDTTWQIVTVRDYPVAAFTYSPVSPIVGETVTFNASSSTPNGGTIVRYDWDFGDENSANVTVPTTPHVYATEGNYNVTLIIRDSEGLSDTTWQIVTVRDYPIAAFTHWPSSPLVSQTVTFDASSSTADGGTIVSYDWDFDDGSNTTGKIVTHNYTVIGNYNVTLTVTDDEALTDTAWTIVTVRKRPFANFTYSPSTPLVNEMVTFNASLSTPDGGTIVSYKWDFGDGSPLVTEADPITNHTYTAFGTHNVILTVEDSEGVSDTCSDTVRILIAPIADFSYSPTMPIVNETVTFGALGSHDPDGSIVSYRWDFDDGNITVAGAVITHTYTAEGTYNVTLTVTDDDGLNDTLWKLVTVYTFLYVHDVAITSVETSATEAYVGQTVDITVVSKNEGTAVESFSVTAYYNGISVGTKAVTNLLPDKEITLKFSLDTTIVPPGDYTISAQASTVSGETDTDDNNLTNGTLKVKLVGDVNGDGVIDMMDVSLACYAAFTISGHPRWDPRCDMDQNGIVDMMDISIICYHFLEHV